MSLPSYDVILPHADMGFPDEVEIGVAAHQF